MFLPQQKRSVDVAAQVWSAPAARMRTSEVDAATGVALPAVTAPIPSWPSMFSPQQRTSVGVGAAQL